MFLTVTAIRTNDYGTSDPRFADCGKTRASVRIFRSYGTPHSLKSLRYRSEIGGQDSVFQSSGIGVARLALFDDSPLHMMMIRSEPPRRTNSST